MHLHGEQTPPSLPDWAEIVGGIGAARGGGPRALAFIATLRALPPPPPPPDPNDALALAAASLGPPPPPPVPPACALATSLLRNGCLTQATELALEEPATLGAELQTRVLLANLEARP